MNIGALRALDGVTSVTDTSCRTSRELRDRRHRLAHLTGVPSPPETRAEAKEAAMYGSMGSDLARQRMEERMREAENFRLTKATRAARSAAHRHTARRVVRTALTSLIWPIKH